MHRALIAFSLLACQRTEPEVEPTIPAVVVEGEITWTLDFDEAAEARGWTDCSYARTYRGQQFLDRPWLCAGCEVLVEGEAVMTEGEDCYAQISDQPGGGYEAWGFGGGHFYRVGLEQYPMWEPLADFVDAGEGELSGLAWDSDYTVDGGGWLNLSAQGVLSYRTDPELLPDPLAPRQTDYACGWPRDDPGDLPLDYRLAEGRVFPNLKLTDQCGEEVLLWDLYGSWIVIDGTQPDCQPCQDMAAAAPEFVAAMADEGEEVVVVSLMGAGLEAPHETPEASLVASWVETFGISDPVLADRGAAFALFPPYLGMDRFGWPAWVIIDPQMRLVYGQVGFGSWDTAAEVIRSRR